MNLNEPKAIKYPKFDIIKDAKEKFPGIFVNPMDAQIKEMLAYKEEAIIKCAKECTEKYLFIGLENKGASEEGNVYSINYTLSYLPSDYMFNIPGVDGDWLDLDEARKILGVIK